MKQNISILTLEAGCPKLQVTLRIVSEEYQILLKKIFEDHKFHFHSRSSQHPSKLVMGIF